MPDKENMKEITENSTGTQESPNDYKLIIDMIREMDEQCKMLEETSRNIVTGKYNLKTEIITDILQTIYLS